jgi:hypothetical protein
MVEGIELGPITVGIILILLSVLSSYISETEWYQEYGKCVCVYELHGISSFVDVDVHIHSHLFPVYLI